MYERVWLHDPDTLESSFCHHYSNCAVTDFIHRDFMLIFIKTKPDFHIHIFFIFQYPFSRLFLRYHNLIFFFWSILNHWTKQSTNTFSQTLYSLFLHLQWHQHLLIYLCSKDLVFPAWLKFWPFFLSTGLIFKNTNWRWQKLMWGLDFFSYLFWWDFFSPSSLLFLFSNFL